MGNHQAWKLICKFVIMKVFSLMDLVFLELGTHCHLDFKLLDERNNAITSKTFHLKLLNKGYEDMR